MTRKLLTTAAASAALTLALSSAAFAGQLPDNFSAIDANADGQVNYAEFSKFAVKNSGMTRTAAAQKFIKISNGNTSFTEGDLMTAIAMQDQPGWGQTSVATNIQTASQPVPVTTPNTAVLSNTAGADIPRWSDGTPVDLEAASTSYEQSTEVITSGDTPAPTPVPAPITTGENIVDDAGAVAPQVTIESEAEGTMTTESAGEAINVETETPVDIVEDGMNELKSDMKTTVETPELEMEVEPQPEK